MTDSNRARQPECMSEGAACRMAVVQLTRHGRATVWSACDPAGWERRY